ncbi:MAG TPA: dTDP-glucose 4,6-dehydratase [Verrucomicrobia bacterium]|nr:MAG: dTDP-glucose 4,6-dehydratase [Lentisphaerae bacterium GWF2_57_35]HBA84529.1 dTDP-glucose 4,6-dehydratase [Verrucomicrobiota bacterium]
MSREKILVIGSNSFSGASFVGYALQDGAEVVGTSRSPEPSDVFLPYKWVPHDRFTFHQLDLNIHLDETMELVNSFKPDYVVNFAAQSMVPQSWQHPEHWYMTNVVSMVKLHDRLRKCDFIKKYVQISTPEVYGNTSGLVGEDTPYNPSTPYAASKAACDMSLMTFVKAYGFPVVFTRAANVCGPGQQLYRIIPRTIFCIMAGEKLKLQGGGVSVRSFIHMKDVSSGTLQAARAGQAGEIFHLSTDRRISIRDLVQMICDVMGESFDKHVEVAEGRLGLDAAYLLDYAKARKQLGWEPVVSLETIISDNVDWMRKNWDEIRRQPRDYIHKP